MVVEGLFGAWTARRCRLAWGGSTVETAAEDAAEGILTGPATVREGQRRTGAGGGGVASVFSIHTTAPWPEEPQETFFWRDRPASQPYGARATMRGYLTRATQNSALQECGSEVPQGCWRLLAVTQDRSVLGSAGAGGGTSWSIFF